MRFTIYYLQVNRTLEADLELAEVGCEHIKRGWGKKRQMLCKLDTPKRSPFVIKDKKHQV